MCVHTLCSSLLNVNSSLCIVVLYWWFVIVWCGFIVKYAAYSYWRFIMLCCVFILWVHHYMLQFQSLQASWAQLRSRQVRSWSDLRATNTETMCLLSQSLSFYSFSVNFDLTANNYEPVLCNNKNIIRSDRPTAYDELVAFSGPAYNGESLHRQIFCLNQQQIIHIMMIPPVVI